MFVCDLVLEPKTLRQTLLTFLFEAIAEPQFLAKLIHINA
jgi:hypothetical protein